jgi:hypothetical protein
MGDSRESEAAILQKLSLAKKPISPVFVDLEGGDVETGYIVAYSRRDMVLLLSPDTASIDVRLSFQEHEKNWNFRRVDIRKIRRLDVFPAGPGTIVPHRQEPEKKPKKK